MDAASTRPADLMRSALEGVAARDVERTTAFADESSYLDFVVLGPIVGKTAAQAFFVELFAAVPDLQFDILRVMNADDGTAVGQWQLQGTFSGGRFQGIDPTGRRVDIRGVDIMEFDNGVLRRNTVYYDGLTFARQIGLLPAEGTPADRALLSAFNGLTRVKQKARQRRR